jgi:hypothetical protein
MDVLITIVLIAITPLCLFVIALLHPPAASAMGKHTGIVIAVSIAGAFILAFAFHDVVVAPCRATTHIPLPTTSAIFTLPSTKIVESGASG